MIGFTVTTRVVLLFLCGTLPLMFVKTHLDGAALFVLVNLAIALLVYVDWRLSPKPRALEVGRICPAKFSLGEANEVILLLTNHSFRALEITLRDEFPEDFKADQQELQVRLEPRSETRIRYEVTPQARGDYLFGNIHLRYRGLLELVVLQQRFNAGRRVEVYPNIKSISRLEFSIRRSHLVESGLISERRRGSGTEFESMRPYVRGDEFRKMDWKASARKGQLVVRQFQNETNQSVFVFIDHSRSMGAKTGGLTRLDAAINAALLLGYYVVRKEDKMGLLTFSDRVTLFFPAKRGKRHFYEILGRLYNLPTHPSEANFQEASQALIKNRTRRSLIVLLTDLTAGDSSMRLRQSFTRLKDRHVLLVVSLIDPLWRERSAHVPTNPESTAQKAAAIDTLGRLELLKAELEGQGIGVLLLSPEEAGSSLLATYVRLKLREIL